MPFFFSRKETTYIQTDSRIRRTFSRPNYQHSWIYELVKSCGNSPIILTKQETFSLHFGRNINECRAMKKFRLEAVSRKMGTTVIGSLFNGNATLRHFVIQVTLSNFKVNYITKKYIEPQTICIYPLYWLDLIASIYGRHINNSWTSASGQSKCRDPHRKWIHR